MALNSLLISLLSITDGQVCDSQGIQYRTFEKHFSDNDRSICDGSTEGMVRIRVDAKSDKILGATIIGKNAGNMISEITLAIQSGTGLGSLAAVIHPYPTNAEAIRQTGDLFNKTKVSTHRKLPRIFFFCAAIDWGSISLLCHCTYITVDSCGKINSSWACEGAALSSRYGSEGC